MSKKETKPQAQIQSPSEPNGPEDGIPAVDVIRMTGVAAGTLTVSRDALQDHTFQVPNNRLVSISDEELWVLRAILSRDFTAAISHGGLKGLLTLTDDEVRTFRALVDRIEL